MIEKTTIPNYTHGNTYSSIVDALREVGYEGAVKISFDEFPALATFSSIAGHFKRHFPGDIIHGKRDGNGRILWREKKPADKPIEIVGAA